MERIKIDLLPSGVMPNVYASQYDIGRRMRFVLTYGGESYVLTGAENISIILRKPDNSEQTISLENTSSDYVEWVTSEDEIDLAGIYIAEIRIEEGSSVIGSANFLLKAEEDPLDGRIEVRSASGIIASFETALSEPLVSLKANFLCSGGNGTPSTPIPLVPFTELNVTRTGVNVWDEEWELGDLNTINGDNYPDNTRIRSKNYVPIAPNTTYYYKCDYNSVVCFYDKDKNYINVGSNTLTANSTFTSANDVYYMRFSVSSAYGTTYNNDISINYPATDTEYHAYNGQTLTVAFGQTVYGGVYDKSGRLTITHGFSTHTWGEYGYKDVGTNCTRGVLLITSDGMGKNHNLTDLCNVAPCSYDYSDTNHFFIESDGVNTAAFVWLPNDTSNDTVINIAYELATPIEVDITPAFLSAIQGQNNVFHDGNGTVELEYLDLKV